MALSYEQFKALRAKNLSARQIADFESGKQPTGIRQPIQPPAPQPFGERLRGADVLGKTAGFYKDVAVGGARGIGSTLSGLASLGQRGLERTIGAGLRGIGIDRERPARTAGEIARERFFTPEGAVQRGAFAGEQLAEFIAPSSRIAQFEKGMRLPGRIGTEALAFGGVTAAQTGEVGEEAKTGMLLGALFPVAGAALKPVGGLIKKQVPKLLSYTSDVPESAIKEVIKRNREVGKVIKDVDERKVLKSTQEVVRGLRKTMSKEWQDGVGFISTKYKGQKFGLNQKETKMLSKIVDDFGVDVPKDIKSMSFKTGSNLMKEINELYGKSAVREGAEGITVRKFKDLFKKKIISSFGGEKGDVANLYKNYSTKHDVFTGVDDLFKAFETKRPIKQATALGRMKSIFSENKGAYLDAVKDLEKATGKDVLSKITALEFKPLTASKFKYITTGGGLTTKKGMIEKAIDMVLFPLTSPRLIRQYTRALGEKPTTGIRGAVPKGVTIKAVEELRDKTENNENK